MDLLRCALAVLLMLQLTGCATAGRGAPPAHEGSYTQYPSGLRLVVYARGSETHSTLHIAYRVGAVDEPLGQEGISQLALALSQLSRSRGPGSPALKERLGAVSGTFRATTGYDVTELWSRVPAQQLPRVLELEAQRMRDPLAHVTEAEFLAERERLAGVQGLVQRLPAPRDLLQQAVLEGNAYGRSLWGTPESVRALDFETVRAWAHAHFVPRRAVVVVTGGLSPAEVSRAVGAAFEPLALGRRAEPFERTPASLPEGEPRELMVKSARVSRPQLWMVWRAPGLGAGQHVEAQAMVSMLQSELIPALRTAMPASERIRMTAGAWSMHGVTLIYLTARLQREDQVHAVRERVAERLGSRWGTRMGEGTAAEMRERVLSKARAEAHALSAEAIARYLRSTGRHDYPAAWPAQVQQTSLANIHGYAQRYLQAQQAYTFLLIPEADAVQPNPFAANARPER